MIHQNIKTSSFLLICTLIFNDSMCVHRMLSYLYEVVFLFVNTQITILVITIIMMIIADNNSNINNTHGRNSNNINNKGIARSSDENGRKPEQTNTKLVRPSLDVPHANDEGT